jgi:hypothetical protein
MLALTATSARYPFHIRLLVFLVAVMSTLTFGGLVKILLRAWVKSRDSLGKHRKPFLDEAKANTK